MRVVINGFGRIGRSVLRAMGGRRRWPGIEIVGINDIAAPEMCAYLFEYDSVFGPWRGTVALEGGALVVDGRAHSADRHGGSVDAGPDGRGSGDGMHRAGPIRVEVAARGLRAGAGRVLVSGPSAAAEVTVVLGANEAVLAGQRIVSNASCTTNALAPLVKAAARGVRGGDGVDDHDPLLHRQPAHGGCAGGGFRAEPGGGAVDGADHDLGAAAAGRGAAGGGGADRGVGGAGAGGERLVRSIWCVMTERPASVAAVNAVLAAAGGVIGATDRALVSTDLRARPESIVMALPETRVTRGRDAAGVRLV